MRPLLVLALLFVSACSTRGLLEEPWCSAETREPVVLTSTPTYHRDIAPLLEKKCYACHFPGGPGGFDLADQFIVESIRELINIQTATRLMPPWPPEQCCTGYRFDRSLTDEQIAMIAAWATGGAPPGKPEDRPPPEMTEEPGLSRVDRTLAMPEPYIPALAENIEDDQRCFLLDWPSDQEEYVTGINVRPLRGDLVHHVIVYVAEEDLVEYFQDRDAEDDGPGWDCYGGVGNRVSGSLGGWAPGFSGVDFPAGTGRKVKPKSKLVLEMHYHTHLGINTNPPDQTSVEFSLASSVENDAETVLVLHPQWLVGDGMSIEAGEKDAAWAVRYDPTTYFDGDEMTLYNVTLHMHALGTRGRVMLLHEDGTSECLLEISRWDYNWQGEYWFRQPKILKKGDKLYLECHWDNSAENQPAIGKEKPAPRDLAWGNEGEMCMATLYAVPGK